MSGQTAPDAAVLRTDGSAWDAFVAGIPMATFHQATPWSEASGERGWGSTRIVAELPDGPIGAQILLRRSRPAPWTRGVIRRGPVAHGFTAAGVAGFTAQLRRQAGDLHLIHVFADPEVPRGGPEAELFLDAGWRRCLGLEVAQTRVIDLSLPRATLWSELSSTARWSVNRAERMGVTVAAEPSDRDLTDFGRLYREHELRLGPRLHYRANYEGVFQAFDASGNAFVLVARDASGTALAAIMLVASGGRIFELYDASTRQGPAAKFANYAVQWQGILRGREMGLSLLDLWGTDEPNLARFKAHFGGHERFYDGPFELIIDRPAYLATSALHRLRSMAVRIPRGRRSRA